MSPLMVFFASLVGSSHCVAMCGGFAMLSAHSSTPLRNLFSYHTGRLITYLLLGGLSGFFGTTLDRLGGSFGVTQFASSITAALLIGSGVIGILRGRVSQPIFIPLRFVHTLKKWVTPTKRVNFFYYFSTGFFSTLLPCGWLYTYLVVAAGTGSIPAALLTMFFFWIGTLPLLSATSTISSFLSLPLQKHMPIVASFLMIAAGVFSFWNHFRGTESGAHESCPTHVSSAKDLPKT